MELIEMGSSIYEMLRRGYTKASGGGGLPAKSTAMVRSETLLGAIPTERGYIYPLRRRA